MDKPGENALVVVVVVMMGMVVVVVGHCGRVVVSECAQK